MNSEDDTAREVRPLTFTPPSHSPVSMGNTHMDSMFAFDPGEEEFVTAEQLQESAAEEEAEQAKDSKPDNASLEGERPDNEADRQSGGSPLGTKPKTNDGPADET